MPLPVHLPSRCFLTRRVVVDFPLGPLRYLLVLTLAGSPLRWSLADVTRDLGAQVGICLLLRLLALVPVALDRRCCGLLASALPKAEPSLVRARSEVGPGRRLVAEALLLAVIPGLLGPMGCMGFWPYGYHGGGPEPLRHSALCAPGLLQRLPNDLGRKKR